MSFPSPRNSITRRHRSDSIPEDSVAPPESLRNSSDAVDNSMELLMRHSSPLVRTSARASGSGVSSPLADRTGSPSPLRLNRPRSNPRNRTPNRATEEQPERVERRVSQRQESTEGQRITIRPMAGAAVGTNMAGTRIRETSRGVGNGVPSSGTTGTRSRKQGPSHRKIRRWNNDNFVNLAAEISNGRSSLAAAEALLLGSANASKHRSILDPSEHESKAITQFREDQSLQTVRQQFADGELPNRLQPAAAPPSRGGRDLDPSLWTPEERFCRIEGRLRRILVKACENSYAASQVVNILEDYLIRMHAGKMDKRSHEEWLDLLLEPPTVASRRLRRSKNDYDDAKEKREELTARFLFDADSSTGGFHRLLLHGVCQFHGLTAASSTTQVVVKDKDGNEAATNAR
ncbi:MAG: hypothetical protein SGARI_004043, partial [Bacillariaceae sp.]